MTDHFGKETGTIFRHGSRVDNDGQSLNSAVRKALAEHQRLLAGPMERTKRMGGRFPSKLGGKRSTTLDDGTIITTWVNPFGLRPILQANVSLPAIPEEEEETSGQEYIGFVYIPFGVGGPYWGEPFEEDGVEINPPLGTPFSSNPWDMTNFGWRRMEYSQDDGDWVCVHNQDALGGNRWKLSFGRLLIWHPIYGWWTRSDLASLSGYGIVVYQGNVLCSSPDTGYEFVAAAVSSADPQTTLYGIVVNSRTYKVVRCQVDFNADFDDETPVDERYRTSEWEESATFVLPNPYGLRSYPNAIFNEGSCDINASCNEATVIAYYDLGYYNQIYTTPIKIRWDSSLNVTIVEEPIDGEGFSESGGLEQGSYETTVIDEAKETDSHCFINIFSPLYKTTGVTYSGTYYGRTKTALKAYYTDDTDEINYLIGEHGYFGEQDGGSHNVYNYHGEEDPENEQLWGSGYEKNEDYYRIKKELVKLYLNDQLLEEVTLYDYYEQSIISWELNSSDGGVLADCPSYAVGANDFPTGDYFYESWTFNNQANIPIKLMSRDGLNRMVQVKELNKRRRKDVSDSPVCGNGSVLQNTFCNWEFEDIETLIDYNINSGNQCNHSFDAKVNSASVFSLDWSGNASCSSVQRSWWGETVDVEIYSRSALYGVFYRSLSYPFNTTATLHMPNSQVLSYLYYYDWNLAANDLQILWTGGDVNAKTDPAGLRITGLAVYNFNTDTSFGVTGI